MNDEYAKRIAIALESIAYELKEYNRRKIFGTHLNK